MSKFELDVAKNQQDKNLVLEVLFEVPNPHFNKKNEKQTELLKMFTWGALAKDLIEHYKVGDFLLIEGKIFFQASTTKQVKTLKLRINKLYSFKEK